MTFTVMLLDDLSGKSKTRQPLSNRYSVMPFNISHFFRSLCESIQREHRNCKQGRNENERFHFCSFEKDDLILGFWIAFGQKPSGPGFEFEAESSLTHTTSDFQTVHSNAMHLMTFPANIPASYTDESRLAFLLRRES